MDLVTDSKQLAGTTCHFPKRFLTVFVSTALSNAHFPLRSSDAEPSGQLLTVAGTGRPVWWPAIFHSVFIPFCFTYHLPKIVSTAFFIARKSNGRLIPIASPLTLCNVQCMYVMYNVVYSK